MVMLVILLQLSSQANNADLKKLLKSVYCYCGCSRETIEVCICGVAQEIEKNFKQKLTLEKTVDQIKSEYLAQYGSQFDAIMKAEGFNLVAYIVPFVLLAIFGGISVVVLKKQKAVQIVTQPAGSTNLDELEKEIQQYRQQR